MKNLPLFLLVLMGSATVLAGCARIVNPMLDQTEPSLNEDGLEELQREIDQDPLETVMPSVIETPVVSPTMGAIDYDSLEKDANTLQLDAETFE